MFLLTIAAGGSPPAAQNSGHRLEGLLAGTADGDAGAFEQLYLQTKTAVYGFALSILRNPQNAEDVMQETYVRVYAAAGAYQPQGKPMAWLLTIVRNLSLMKLREAKRWALPLDGQALPETDDFTESATDRLVLHSALTALSDEERQIVVLHSVSGLKHREIAEVLTLPLSTTLSKYHRALAKLKKIVKEAAE